MTTTTTPARVTTGRDTGVADVHERSTTTMVTTPTATPAPSDTVAKPRQQFFGTYPRFVAYVLVAVATALIALDGFMRPAAAVVIGMGITALLALMEGRYPITDRAAIVTALIIAASIGLFEAVALSAVGPLIDASRFAFASAIALLITHRAGPVDA